MALHQHIPRSTLLQEMQGMLARFYDAPNEYDVHDFLTTERHRLGLSAHCSDEQVLIAEDESGTRLGVFIDEQVLARLVRKNPLHALTEDNLADYCTALEGVSHFHYLTWRAVRGWPVSLLELELQAEVDKYVGAVLLFTRQQCGQFPSHLHQRMFDRVTYTDQLDAESAARYRLANRHAARYCRKLDESYLRTRCKRPEAWLAELRKFYRCGHAEKVRRAAD
jgi:hypothetical protein